MGGREVRGGGEGGLPEIAYFNQTRAESKASLGVPSIY
jgi:hypothetical protein